MSGKSDNTDLSFGDMLSLFGEHIVSYCNFRANTYDEANDLVQEVKVAIWQSMGTMRAANRFQALWWVNSVMRNTVAAHFRRKRIKTVPLEAVADLAAPEEAEREHIQSLMAYLTVVERETLQLLFDGYSRAEIAAKQGISENGVNQRIRRIVKHLQDINRNIYGE